MLPAALESIAELASFAEIRSFGLHTLLSKRNRAEAQQAGLTYSVHGPFGYTGIWDLDEAERLKALDEHRRHLEASAEIGARLYVVHPDWRPEVKPRDPAVVAQLDRSFETLLAWQDELGVEIVVENMPGTGMSHFTHPGDLDLHGLGLILDVGHASISGCLDEWLDDPRAPLRHLHVHDNHGEGDARRSAPGAGRRRGRRGGGDDRRARRRRLGGARARLRGRSADQPRPPAGARPALGPRGPQRERLARLVGADPSSPSRSALSGSFAFVHTMLSTHSKPNDGNIAGRVLEVRVVGVHVVHALRVHGDHLLGCRTAACRPRVHQREEPVVQVLHRARSSAS